MPLTRGTASLSNTGNRRPGAVPLTTSVWTTQQDGRGRDGAGHNAPQADTAVMTTMPTRGRTPRGRVGGRRCGTNADVSAWQVIQAVPRSRQASRTSEQRRDDAAPLPAELRSRSRRSFEAVPPKPIEDAGGVALTRPRSRKMQAVRPNANQH
jgi:hypothetical protein